MQDPAPVKEVPLKILSAGDGSWRYTLKPPAETWLSLDFDDSTWESMVERPIPEISYDQPGGYQWQACHREKASGLGVARSGKRSLHGRVWVRKSFEVPVPSAG